MWVTMTHVILRKKKWYWIINWLPRKASCSDKINLYVLFIVGTLHFPYSMPLRKHNIIYEDTLYSNKRSLCRNYIDNMQRWFVRSLDSEFMSVVPVSTTFLFHCDGCPDLRNRFILKRIILTEGKVFEIGFK